jgi:hypothetical protein
MHKDQLRALIRDVLTQVGLYSNSAEELLMLTAAVESKLGYYIRQVGGPAKGIFQMEPNTEEDIWENYLAYKGELSYKITSKFMTNNLAELEWNLAYQIIMARIHYLRVPEPLPHPLDKVGLATYWKKYYNTSAGKGTVAKAIDAYEEYVQS